MSAALAAVIIGICWVALSLGAALDALIERKRNARRP